MRPLSVRITEQIDNQFAYNSLSNFNLNLQEKSISLDDINELQNSSISLSVYIVTDLVIKKMVR